MWSEQEGGKREAEANQWAVEGQIHGKGKIGEEGSAGGQGTTTTAATLKQTTTTATQKGLNSTKVLLGTTTVEPKTPTADLVEPGRELKDVLHGNYWTSKVSYVNRKFMYNLCGCVKADRNSGTTSMVTSRQTASL